MTTLGLGRQDAIEYAGEICHNSVRRFLACKAALPSWGPELDAQVKLFVQGLEDWIIANAEWSFETERYFEKNGAKIRETLMVPLLPQVGFD